MKYLLALAIISFFSASKCGEHKEKSGEATEPQVETKKNPEQVTDSVPVCVRKLIDDDNKQSPPNTPVQVDAYLYKGKTVYLVTAHCCDQYNMLYDENCKEICAPSGGFTGRGDGKCRDFDSTAKHVKLIWKNGSK